MIYFYLEFCRINVMINSRIFFHLVEEFIRLYHRTKQQFALFVLLLSQVQVN